MPRLAAILAASMILSVNPTGLPSAQTATPPEGEDAAHSTGRASVRLVRLLSEVPEAVQSRSGPLHDIRVRLDHGNVMVFRRGGEFAALFPIERVQGSADSLRYLYYVEKPTMFWVFAGARTRGILTVPEGGSLGFDTFRLLWRPGESDGYGYIYFPDTAENQGLRFSVVSGQSVDRADPKDTKYWVELGAGERAGF
ncbi:MAG TPA: hypothetical protein VFP58_09330 [Candidatus Eisenbacteria bacterium]|nr:hypothetical protein [Candidatus Eisenbacteria bacterium]